MRPRRPPTLQVPDFVERCRREHDDDSFRLQTRKEVHVLVKQGEDRCSHIELAANTIAKAKRQKVGYRAMRDGAEMASRRLFG
jgi:hypothetical protein